MGVNKVIFGGETLIDLTGDTVSADKMLRDTTAHDKSGTSITGTMANHGAASTTIQDKEQEITIPQGYHNGEGKVGIDATEQAKIIAGNIRRGVTMLGIEGGVKPASEVTFQEKTITPETAQQTILPDENIDYLAKVIVAAIPYKESENPPGGITVTIGGC